MSTSDSARPSAESTRNVARDELFTEVEAGLIAFFGDLCHALSFPRSYGQIYGFAFVSTAPVSFEDVVEQLQLSKGSASQGIRWLKSMGAIVPVADHSPIEGRRSRREYFVPNTDFSSLIQIIFRERLENPLEQGGIRLANLWQALGSMDSGSVNGGRDRVGHLRHRLRELRQWHQRTRKLAPRLFREADR